MTHAIVGIPDRRAQPTRVAGVKYATDPVDGADLVNADGAAAIAGVSVRTIYNWMAKGLVEIRLTPSGHKRIVAESLFRDAGDSGDETQESTT